MRSEAALLLLLLLDSESELLRGRLQSLRYTRKLFFTGWFPLLKPLAGRSAKHPNKEHYRCTTRDQQGHGCPAAPTHGSVLCGLVTVTVRAGAGSRASPSLPLPLGGPHYWQLGGPNGAVPMPRSDLAVSILWGASWTFWRACSFRVLLGEEHRGPPANFMCWGRRRIGTQTWKRKVSAAALMAGTAWQWCQETALFLGNIISDDPPTAEKPASPSD